MGAQTVNLHDPSHALLFLDVYTVSLLETFSEYWCMQSIPGFSYDALYKSTFYTLKIEMIFVLL